MKITFLGTGTSQGIPIIGSTHEVCLSKDKKDKRLRSSILIEWENATYIVDCGPDFRQQLLREGVSNLDGILFSHYHADHTAGLDDVRPFSQRNGEVMFYCDAEVANNLKERFAYIFATHNRYAGAPKVTLNIIDSQPFNLKDKLIQPIEVMHGKLKIYGYRIGDFAYITDAKTIEDKEIKKLKGLKVLVVNALRKEPHPTHFNVDEALAFIREIKPETTYLTHISNRLGFHKQVSKELPANVYLAYDGLSFEV